ncbi:MAG: xanthine dehydrogenase family protein molybdopterin-binding subunit [Reyranella sp.]|uniref:xanthine dehydrogenase family protein molybdopterin-binding subunit n=1 Tax=Reyranella sp. TaxID=1929291 RepID=UPI001ACD1A85|nr:molybdopterin cofactor-binding domain-containing protein [Reyranella sp.]MBN9090092.1 xanthine dehydrogenase family protein molybdopterin-binding subunit [Reyranella sp.]
MNAPNLPTSLVDNPRLDRWIHFNDDRTVRIASGKVEIGQGVVTALSQIAADELDLPLERVQLLSGDTDHGPDEMYTTSSLSIEMSGSSIRLVCAEVRAKALDRAALRLNCSPEDLTVVDGQFLRNGEKTDQDYWTVAHEIDLSQAPSGTSRPKKADGYKVVGQSVPRLDLPAKVTGGIAYVHDVLPRDVLHARVLRQPNPGATLAALDEAAIRRAAKGELQIVRETNFVAFVSPVESVAQAAAAAAPAHARWDDLRRLTPAHQEAAWLKGQPAEDRHIGAPARETAPKNLAQITVSRPYIAHASMGPSCALAEFRDGHLTVWSHGQGMHPLRKNLAPALGLPIEAITAKHLHGPGCYGHNGADDAALDAALVAMRLPGKTIRLQWRREEEFGFEPVGPAMLVSLHVDLDDKGRPADWTTEIWSATHVQRPGSGSGYLLATEALPNPPPEVKPTDPPEARGGGGTRNAVPLYDVPAHRILHHLVQRGPVRTSALRGLGALPNVYAIEMLMDELAARVGEDPVAYRLSILSEPRGRRLVEHIAAMSDWKGRGPSGSGRGLGMAFARYKNKAAYCAVAAAVTVEEVVRVDRVWCVADAGLVINPDGARNQLEGGIVQALSWTLKEQVRFDDHGIASLDWDGYPILRFSEVPEIEAELVDGAGNPTLGVGECSCGPTAAAVGNAVAHALGVRIHDMPLTRERILKALG